MYFMDNTVKSLDEQVRGLDLMVGSLSLFVAALSAEELESKGALMMPKKKYIGEKAVALAKDLEDSRLEIKKRIETGYGILNDKIKELSFDLQDKFRREFQSGRQKVLDMADPVVDPEEQIKKYLPCNTFQEFLGFSNEMIEWVYQVGRSLFEEKKFWEASGLFHILLSFNTFMPSYWIALGLSEKELRNYEGAWCMFNSLSGVDPNNLFAHYNSAELYLELGEIEEALKELQILSDVIENTKQEQYRASHDALYKCVIQKKSKSIGAL